MADTKIGRDDGHRTPFAIMHDAAETGDMADIALMREWVTASYRKHSISWSQRHPPSPRPRRGQDRRRAGGRGPRRGDGRRDRPCALVGSWLSAVTVLGLQPASRLRELHSDNRRCVAAAVEYLVDIGYPVGVDEAGPVPVIGLVTNPPQQQ